MLDRDRLDRNARLLLEMSIEFRSKVDLMLSCLSILGSSKGFDPKPRFQEAFRTLKDQRAAGKQGTSKTTLGLHNVVVYSGEEWIPYALAVDVLQDDRPKAPSPLYVASLAIAADRASLETGALWGLPLELRKPRAEAMRLGDLDRLSYLFATPAGCVGWDPCHVQTGRGVDILRLAIAHLKHAGRMADVEKRGGLDFTSDIRPAMEEIQANEEEGS